MVSLSPQKMYGGPAMVGFLVVAFAAMVLLIFSGKKKACPGAVG